MNDIRNFHKDNRQVEQLDEIIDQDIEDEIDEQKMIDGERRVNHISRSLNGSESLLDIGTGLGYFLDAISPHTDEAVGRELSRERRQYLKENSEHTILKDTASALEEYGEGHFDIITMFHVLEHFPNPKSQLSSIQRLLSEDGQLIIEVPNYDDWLPDVSEDYFRFYHQPAHIFYFTESTLTDLLNRVGFESKVKQVQRYGIENARHWIKKGEPQPDSPDMVGTADPALVDYGYVEVLKELGLSDTLWCVASK